MARIQRLPPIHALIAFESAARLGGFAQAATELCITPSAVSHRIRQLEAQLGEQLFERSPTGVRPSESGQRCLQGVREAFDRLAHLSRAEAPDVLRLRVGSPPTFARNMLIPRLPEFYRQWPDIEIEVAVAAPMQEKPERHDVDIRFGAGPFDERVTTRMFDDTVVALAAPDYSTKRALHDPADLARAELLRSPLVAWKPWFDSTNLKWPEPSAARTSPTWASCWRRQPAAWGSGVQPAHRRKLDPQRSTGDPLRRGGTGAEYVPHDGGTRKRSAPD